MQTEEEKKHNAPFNSNGERKTLISSQNLNFFRYGFISSHINYSFLLCFFFLVLIDAEYEPLVPVEEKTKLVSKQILISLSL